MLDIMQKAKETIHILEKLLPVFSFLTPFLILYHLYPDSFQITYQGRTFYLFFLWLVSLEIILNWEGIRTHISTLKPVRTISLIVSLLLPTIYIVVANYCGLNAIIVEVAKKNNVPLADLMPLSTEYLVFTVLFALIILLAHGKKRLMDFSIATFLLGSIGAIFAIDDFYPYGRFTPFQILVPATAKLAASVLNLMGYETRMFLISNPEWGSMPYLEITNTQPPTGFGIAWPCAGVESLLIYMVTILLFLKKASIPWKHKIVYLVIGAAITYVINILRVVSIFVISISGGDVWTFHNYYGWLFSIIWIISYPLIIIGSRILWRKIRNWKAIHDVSESSKAENISFGKGENVLGGSSVVRQPKVPPFR